MCLAPRLRPQSVKDELVQQKVLVPAEKKLTVPVDKKITVPPPEPPTADTWLTLMLPVLVIASGVLHGALQEQLMDTLRDGNSALLISGAEFASCSLLSIFWLALSRQNPLDAPRKPLSIISVLVCCSLVSGNIALRWVSYPLKVVVKSCKLLPTMAIGSLLLGKHFAANDQVSFTPFPCVAGAADRS